MFGVVSEVSFSYRERVESVRTSDDGFIYVKLVTLSKLRETHMSPVEETISRRL